MKLYNYLMLATVVMQAHAAESLRSKMVSIAIQTDTQAVTPVPFAERVAEQVVADAILQGVIFAAGAAVHWYYGKAPSPAEQIREFRRQEGQYLVCQLNLKKGAASPEECDKMGKQFVANFGHEAYEIVTKHGQ